MLVRATKVTKLQSWKKEIKKGLQAVIKLQAQFTPLNLTLGPQIFFFFLVFLGKGLFTQRFQCPYVFGTTGDPFLNFGNFFLLISILN